jgi:endonuclease YncB( thermonuclease family)
MSDSIPQQLKKCFTKPLIAFCLCALFLSIVPALLFPMSADARCPNGSHMSPSGDCEKVTHSGGLPRCPDGDCERVSSANSDNDRSSDSENDEGDDDDSEREPEETNNDDDENVRNEETSILNTQTILSRSTECKGSADCFRGTVTEIVDGDTLDVNNVRIRLSMVNTPEAGEEGYDEATDTTESECPIGSEALVDEDDGQRGGSFGRLIGVVYFNGSSSSLNELLLATEKAVLYGDFCGVSEFANEYWVTRYGCSDQ